jgi:hypothetical protein
MAKSKQKPPEMKSSRRERRKKLNSWIDLNFLHKQKGDSKPVHGIGSGKSVTCDICGARAFTATYKDGIWSCDKCNNKVCEICGRRAKLFLVHPDKDCTEFWCDECIRDEEQMFNDITKANTKLKGGNKCHN